VIAERNERQVRRQVRRVVVAAREERRLLEVEVRRHVAAAGACWTTRSAAAVATQRLLSVHCRTVRVIVSISHTGKVLLHRAS